MVTMVKTTGNLFSAIQSFVTTLIWERESFPHNKTLNSQQIVHISQHMQHSITKESLLTPNG